jgi:hypothetical protein
MSLPLGRFPPPVETEDALRRASSILRWHVVDGPTEVDKKKDKKKAAVNPVPIDKRLALTLPECSAVSSMKVCRLRAAIWDGQLAFIQSGERGRYLIRREELERFLRSQEEREVAR